MADAWEDEGEEEGQEDAYAQADLLLAEMRKFKLQATAALGDVEKSEASSDAAAREMRQQLGKTAASIISEVARGMPPPQSGRSSELGEEEAVLGEDSWTVAEGRVGSCVAEAHTEAHADGSGKRATADKDDSRPESGVGNLVSDISRLASKPLLPADALAYSSRPGAPRRSTAGLASSSEIGTLGSMSASGRGRSVGARLPRP